MDSWTRVVYGEQIVHDYIINCSETSETEPAKIKFTDVKSKGKRQYLQGWREKKRSSKIISLLSDLWLYLTVANAWRTVVCFVSDIMIVLILKAYGRAEQPKR